MVRKILIVLALIALAAGLVFGIVHGYESWRMKQVEEGRTLGRAEVQKLWDDDRAHAQAARIAAEQASAAETARRLQAQQENQRAQDARLAQVQHDAAAAHAAADGLRLRAAAYLDAAGCGHLSGDSALECVRAAAAKVTDVLGRCAASYQQLAADADDARQRGLKCEADYDALSLTPALPASTP